MKKLMSLILPLCMLFTLAACSTQTPNTPQQDVSSAQSQQTNDSALHAGASDSGDSEDSGVPEEETGGKVLVAYFSCTGNTEGIASHIADALGAGTYEIVPEEPYTSADLNYGDSSSRTTLEQNDGSARPAISGSVENMEDYGIVFLGYPIWWGQAPKIIYTFLESYDFSGKTIVPFCTSGSSGIGSSAANLHSSASDSVNWLDGIRFSSNASQSDIEEWINGLQIEITAQ